MRFKRLWAIGGVLVQLESPLQGGVHGLCFTAFETMVWKLLNSKVFMNSKIELNYFFLLEKS